MDVSLHNLFRNLILHGAARSPALLLLRQSLLVLLLRMRGLSLEYAGHARRFLRRQWALPEGRQRRQRRAAQRGEVDSLQRLVHLLRRHKALGQRRGQAVKHCGPRQRRLNENEKNEEGEKGGGGGGGGGD